MNFYTTKMQNLSTGNSKVENIRIIIADALSTKYFGDARMISFDNIWVETPDTIGRYELKPKAIKELAKHSITNLDELFHKAWLVDNGNWILHNIKRVK